MTDNSLQSNGSFVVSHADQSAAARDLSLSPDARAFVDRLARVSLAILVIGQAAAGRTDSDIWGHMAIGLDMLRDGRFLWVDPYSFTHDQAWVNHEWLWDVLVASTYRAGGLGGVVALRAVLIGLVLWIVMRATRHVSSRAQLLTLAMVAVGCISQWRSTRPQLASLVLYALLLPNMRAWWTPLLFVAWANLHGGWLFGLGAVLAFTAITPSPRNVLVAAACAAATLVNPYGVGLWRALAQAMSRGWADVTEWQPVWRVAAGIDALILLFAIVGLSALVWKRAPRHQAWAVSWTVAALVAAATSRRLIAFAALTAALLLVPRLAAAWPAGALVGTTSRRLAAAVTLAVAVAFAATAIRPTLTCFPPDPAWHAPEPGAVRFLRRTDVHRIVPHFDYGEYAIFQLRDRLQVAIDNRRETVYSAAAVRDNQRFTDGLDPDYPDRIGADAVWWPAADRFVLDGLAARGWQTAYAGPRTVVLTRSGGDTVYDLDPGLGTPCFPAP